MCCFTRRVKKVSETRIFARSSVEANQFLVYEMKFSALDDLALVLPIPVAQPCDENAVRFINLEAYSDFFVDLAQGFPAPESSSRGGGMGGMGVKDFLKVQKVGKYEASFVPTVSDFDRLDDRFRLPSRLWDKLPQYRNYGFVVFKLMKEEFNFLNKLANSHPMAFEFPRQDNSRLFFPTVHIHDEQLHAKAKFDHILYMQLPMGNWKTWTAGTNRCSLPECL